MYRKHFALTAFPFDMVLEPEALFASGAITEAEARLKHLLELRAIGLVTGEAGSGKTTVCRKIASELHSGLYRVFYVPLSTGNVMDIYGSFATPSYCQPQLQTFYVALLFICLFNDFSLLITLELLL